MVLLIVMVIFPLTAGAKGLASLDISGIQTLSIAGITEKYADLRKTDVQLEQISLDYMPATDSVAERYFLTAIYEVLPASTRKEDAVAGTVTYERIQVILTLDGEIELVDRSPIIRSSNPHFSSDGRTKVKKGTDEHLMDFNFSKAPIFVVMDMYTSLTGRKVDLGRWSSTPITVLATKLNKKQVAHVIEAALLKAGLRLHEKDDGTFALRPVE